MNKETHGGRKSGSGRGTEEDHSPSRKGGRLGGAAAAKRQRLSDLVRPISYLRNETQAKLGDEFGLGGSPRREIRQGVVGQGAQVFEAGFSGASRPDQLLRDYAYGFRDRRRP